MATRAKPNTKSESDTYTRLVRRFPLKPLKSDQDHEQAAEIVQQLIGRKLDAGASDYLDTLVLLVNKYEDENHSPRGLGLSPRDALRAIMNVNDMSQADMGKVIGSESAVSMFLKGERELSKSHIKALVSRFRVDARLFL